MEKILITEEGFEKYTGGMIATGFIPSTYKDTLGILFEIEIPRENCFDMRGKGIVYIKNKPWTAEEMIAMVGNG